MQIKRVWGRLEKENRGNHHKRPKLGAWSKNLEYGSGRQELGMGCYLYKCNFPEDFLPKLAAEVFLYEYQGEKDLYGKHFLKVGRMDLCSTKRQTLDCKIA